MNLALDALKKLEDYKPIDYSVWVLGDEARNGVNIKRLDMLKPNELEIFNAAIPDNDARNDPGQAEIVTYFGLKLLEYLPGIREVVVPACIHHDIGFAGEDPGAWLKLVRSGEEY